MCEVCRGNLQEQLNGGSARLWVIKGQARWLRSNEVDFHGFLGIQFKRLTPFDMPMKRGKPEPASVKRANRPNARGLPCRSVGCQYIAEKIMLYCCT